MYPLKHEFVYVVVCFQCDDAEDAVEGDEQDSVFFLLLLFKSRKKSPN